LIIIVVVVAILLVLIIGALLAYIFILRKKNTTEQTNGQSTELKVANNIEDNPPDFGGKVELPVEGGNAWELPSIPAQGKIAPIKIDQPPAQAWSPHPPTEPYPQASPQPQWSSPVQPQTIELPGNTNRWSGKWGYSELPG
jgi:hypothetical protein